METIFNKFLEKIHPELNPLTADNSPQTFNSLVVYALSVQKAFLTGMLISVVSSVLSTEKRED
jgi:hypothetical protein